MSPDDFPQFDDPRVREVMAAAANLVEDLRERWEDETPMPGLLRCTELVEEALFAAQHSRPKTLPPCLRCRNDATCQSCGTWWPARAAQHSRPRREPPCPPCLLVDEVDARAHSKSGTDVAIRVISDPSMPPGKFALVNTPDKDEWRYAGYGYLQAQEPKLPREPEMKIGHVTFNGSDDGSMTIVIPAGCELKCAKCDAVHVSHAARSQREENDE
jgi:hypothetical protein